MKYGKLDYIYDLGDYWQFKIILEKVTDDYNKGYPILIDGANDAPPEDVGGISGFEYFLKIYNNPDNPEHQSYTVWANSQGFRKFDIDHINVMLKFIKYK